MTNTQTQNKKELKTATLKDVIKAHKYLSKDGEYIIIEISINKALQKLIKKYAVTENKERIAGTTNSRYLIKRILTNSLFWCAEYNYMFDTKLVDTGKTKIQLANSESATSLLRNLNSNNIHTLIKEMIKIQRKVIIRAEFNTEIEVLKWTLAKQNTKH